MDQCIQDFIDSESDLPHNILLRNFIIIIFLFSVPTAIFGKYAHITTLLILPIALYFIIWAIALIIRPNRGQFYLYWGSAGIYLSIIFLLIAYKVMSAITTVSPLMVRIVIILYFLVAAFVCIFYAVLIKNGRITKIRFGSKVGGAGAIGGSIGYILSKYFIPNNSNLPLFIISYIAALWLYISFLLTVFI